MSSGGLFGVQAPSGPLFNRKTLFIGTGAEIAAVPLTNPATLFLSTTTEAGYIENELYMTQADGSGRVAVRRAHKHNSASDSDGGDIYDIWTANAGQKMAVGPRFTRPGDFGHIAIQSGGAPTSTHIDAIIGTNVLHTRLKTTAVSNFWTQVYDGGLALSFGNKVEWRIKMQISSPTPATPQILWRQGVNMETVGVAGNGTENRFGMEGCDSDGLNIRVICANGGGTRTNANSTIPMIDAVNPITGYQMLYTPGTNILWKHSLGTIQTVTSNVPSSGAVASDRQLRYGIKTTNAAEKIMYLVADALFYTISDTNWVS